MCVCVWIKEEDKTPYQWLSRMQNEFGWLYIHRMSWIDGLAESRFLIYSSCFHLLHISHVPGTCQRNKDESIGLPLEKTNKQTKLHILSGVAGGRKGNSHRQTVSVHCKDLCWIVAQGVTSGNRQTQIPNQEIQGRLSEGNAWAC